MSAEMFGDELVAAIEKGDGQETAVILREMMYLAGWDTAQNVAFRANFRSLRSPTELQWWTSVPR